MACLPYDALNIFDIVENSSSTTNFSDYTVTTITGENVTNVTSLQAAASGDSYGNVFSILKVILIHLPFLVLVTDWVPGTRNRISG